MDDLRAIQGAHVTVATESHAMIVFCSYVKFCLVSVMHVTERLVLAVSVTSPSASISDA